jgi:hypothetical protein
MPLQCVVEPDRLQCTLGVTNDLTGQPSDPEVSCALAELPPR